MTVRRGAGRRPTTAIRAVILLWLGVVTPGCAGPPAPPEAENATTDSVSGADSLATLPPPAGELPDRSVFVDSALRVDARSRDALRAALGEPDSTAAEVVPNRHVPAVMDTIYTLHYPDLVARFHHPGGGGDLLAMVQVSNNRHLRYPVLGLTVAAIDEAFGRPDEATDSSLTYYCTTCEAGDDPVQLVFLDGELRRVRFGYYVD